MWEDDPIQTQSRGLAVPGRDLESAGLTPFRDLSSYDQRIFDKYKHAIREKIRQEKDLNLSDDFQLAPKKVAKQTELPENCYFQIDLPHSVVTIKIIPNPTISDLSKHITLQRESVDKS